MCAIDCAHSCTEFFLCNEAARRCARCPPPRFRNARGCPMPDAAGCLESRAQELSARFGSGAVRQTAGSARCLPAAECGCGVQCARAARFSGCVRPRGSVRPCVIFRAVPAFVAVSHRAARSSGGCRAKRTRILAAFACRGIIAAAASRRRAERARFRTAAREKQCFFCAVSGAEFYRYGEIYGKSIRSEYHSPA